MIKHCLALLALLCSSSLFALPSGAHVVEGDATITFSKDAVQIHANGDVTIRWDRFDVASNETVVFMQSDEKSDIFNSVISDSASQLLGKLQANCPIYLNTAEGVFIDSTALVDMPGFVAAGGKIVHRGTIHSDQGQVLFLAPLIDNQGKIEAPGGTIAFHGSQVIELGKESLLDVSSDELSGTVTAIGGHIIVEKGAVLAANGVEYGSGGAICLNATEKMVFHGMAEAKGGSLGGNGGGIHLSSNGPLFSLADGHPIVDTSAPHGKTGKVLFDPKFVLISLDGTDSATGNTFASDPSEVAVISGATLQTALDAANVTIQANTDIYFADDVVASTPGNSLILQAGRSINFSGTLTLNNGFFRAIINDAEALSANRDPGTASFQMGSSAQILTQGGDITLDVGSWGGTQLGEIAISGGNIDAGGGNLSLAGYARQDGTSYHSGIAIGGKTTIKTSGAGTLTLDGTGGNGSSGSAGITVSGSMALLQTEDGALSFTGQGGGNGTGEMNAGIRFESGARCASIGTGTISLIGSSGTGTDNNQGIILAGGQITSANGAISLTGTGQGSGGYNYGVRLETGAKLLSTETASITAQGTSLSLGDSNIGLCISSSGATVSSISGDISLTGTSYGTGSMSQGLRVEGGEILSTGTGTGSANITLIGIGGPGTNYCNGISIQGDLSEITSIDGNITLNGTSSGTGIGNDPIFIDPLEDVNTTGSGTITLIE